MEHKKLLGSDLETLETDKLWSDVNEELVEEAENEDITPYENENLREYDQEYYEEEKNQDEANETLKQNIDLLKIKDKNETYHVLPEIGNVKNLTNLLSKSYEENEEIIKEKKQEISPSEDREEIGPPIKKIINELLRIEPDNHDQLNPIFSKKNSVQPETIEEDDSAEKDVLETVTLKEKETSQPEDKNNSVRNIRIRLLDRKELKEQNETTEINNTKNNEYYNIQDYEEYDYDQNYDQDQEYQYEESEDQDQISPKTKLHKKPAYIEFEEDYQDQDQYQDIDNDYKVYVKSKNSSKNLGAPNVLLELNVANVSAENQENITHDNSKRNYENIFKIPKKTNRKLNKSKLYRIRKPEAKKNKGINLKTNINVYIISNVVYKLIIN